MAESISDKWRVTAHRRAMTLRTGERNHLAIGLMVLEDNLVANHCLESFNKEDA